MQWQQSPQYSGMPWGEYLNTDEGQQAQQAFADWGKWTQENAQQTARPTTQAGPTLAPRPMTQYGQQSPFQPPPAQPPPPPPTNPYGFPQGQGVGSMDMTRYTPTSTTPSRTFQFPGMTMGPGGMALDMSSYGGMANNPNRPPSAPIQMSMYGIGGAPMSNMGDMMNQRAAVLAQLLDQAGIYSLAGATGQDIGPPQYNLPEILRNANSMVQSGWQNPFNFGFQDPLAAIAPQAPPSMYPNVPIPSIGGLPRGWTMGSTGPVPIEYASAPGRKHSGFQPSGDLAFLPGPGFQEPDWMRNMANQGYVF